MKNYFLLGVACLLLVSCSGNKEPDVQFLHNEWHFHQAGIDSVLPAQIPGIVHADLMRAGMIPDPYFRENEKEVQWIEREDWIYKTSFEVSPEVFSREHIDLVFEGLDTYATVVLNGDTLLSANNMYREWRVAVKDQLVKDTNQLKVIFESPLLKMITKRNDIPFLLPTSNDGKFRTCPLTRKPHYQYGWDWAPRLLTCGIWKPVYIVGWDKGRIDEAYIKQEKVTEQKAVVELNLDVFSDQDNKYELVVNIYNDGIVVSRDFKVKAKEGISNHRFNFVIPDPELWFPRGYGDQPLYRVEMRLRDGQSLVDVKNVKMGLRQVELVQDDDEDGQSFFFRINGKPVFAKGANMVPMDNLVNRLSPGRYKKLIDDVYQANMNMLRVWGGGLYESDYFYQLCDEKGIMVWQDFMFGNQMYWMDSVFRHNVEAEAIEQIKRLGNHPSVVLWCGDNEIEWLWKRQWHKNFPVKLWDDYKKLSFKLLPSLVEQYDGARPYWPSSPGSGNPALPPNTANRGDMHDWRVHFGPPPFEKYQEVSPRFVSEYGHQGFAHWRTVNAFTKPEDRHADYLPGQCGKNMRSSVLNWHNKQPWGNQKIRMYMDYYYSRPSDFRKFIYLSQVAQAEGVRIGAEHHRRLMPYCMGSLFWQLNDSWPATSWSSIDYGGRWKALHYFAKKFFKPVIVSVVQDKNAVEVYVVSENNKSDGMVLSMDIVDFHGNVLKHLYVDAIVEPMMSRKYCSFDMDSLRKFDAYPDILVNCSLLQGDSLIDQSNFFMDRMKNLRLPPDSLSIDVRAIDQNQLRIDLKAFSLVKNIYLFNDSMEGHFSDNFFDMLPGDNRTIIWKSKEKSPDLNKFAKNIQYYTINQIQNNDNE